ncbi:MAG: hypothetical protein KDM91_12500, partial [Verrucomicrobiae bacterium]|nr:hypothetical protein [Verrucomicrobiae bacterium]
GDGRWRFAASIGDDGAFLEDFRKACEAVDLSRAIDLTITGDGPKKKSLMVWIEPMDEKRSNSTSEQKENAGTDRSVPVLMGRIHAFGFYLDGDKLVPIEPPGSQADYVACSIRSRSWNAVRATGELVVFGKEEDRPQAPITGIGPSGMIGRQNCALDRDGRLHIWGKNLQQRIGEISGLRLFDAEHRFAAGVFLDGSARIWNILPEEPAETYQPTPEEAGDVAKVVASNCGVTFLREDGTIRYVKANGVVPTHGSERFSDVDRLINGFVGLTRDGRLLTWGDSNRVMPPENAPRVIAIRGAGRFIAAKLEDGSWTGWAHEDSPDGARLVLEKLRTIRDEIDLDVYVDKEVWRVAWIQRTAPLLDPRIIGSEWSFFDGTGGSRGDTTIEVTLEKVIWKPKARPLETKLPYSVIAKNEIVIHWGEAERGARFDPDAATVEIWR